VVDLRAEIWRADEVEGMRSVSSEQQQSKYAIVNTGLQAVFPRPRTVCLPYVLRVQIGMYIR
jgi:hypothetical protein